MNKEDNRKTCEMFVAELLAKGDNDKVHVIDYRASLIFWSRKVVTRRINLPVRFAYRDTVINT